ncbi:hypothetical protein OH76DRAFT_1490813 [Lentinus brumalis]|uniref:Uncharacterized protein n=1 Tax=Lentinus brumalis TaxID=2498619 RepID=A0A371CHQ8_9APHY|nr:hypothetical protein OH76DRAFT_1490813 [Polyporus brumalis]
MPTRHQLRSGPTSDSAPPAETLYGVVAPFLVKPGDFLRCIKPLDVYIGGDGALSFLQRECSTTVDALEIYVSDDDWRHIIYHLTFSQHAYQVPCPVVDNVGPAWALMHGLDSVITMRTPKGDIHVYRVLPNIDTLTPIARAWCSLHVCYVNVHHFGAGYPSMLFANRALLSDGEDVDDTDSCNLYVDRGFDIRLSADYWPDIANPTHTCHAAGWMCPAQARTFTDAGALRCRMEPLVTDPVETCVVWRLDTRPCGGTCVMDGGGVLAPWQFYDSL